MNLDLEFLLSTASVIGESLVPREIEWFDENGKSAKYQIYIVEEVSCAAADRIHLGDRRFPEAGKLAVVIAERVRFSADGKSRMTPEQASLLKDGLALALVGAVNRFDAEKLAAKAPEEAKA